MQSTLKKWNPLVKSMLSSVRSYIHVRFLDDNILTCCFPQLLVQAQTNGGGFGGGASSGFGFNSQGTHPVLVRDDIPEYSEVLTETNSDFVVVLGGLKTYTINWDGEIPSQIFIATDGIEM